MTASRTRTAFVGLVTTSLATCVASAAIQISSVEATTPPTIDSLARSAEWADAAKETLTDVVLMVKHDSTNLYLLIDAVGDTNADALQVAAPWGDFINVAFDVDLNGTVTANVDIEYGESAGSSAFGLTYFTATNTFTGMNATNGHLARGFGTSPNSTTAHRFWELALPLSEFRPANAVQLRMGLRVYSPTPAIDESVPVNFEADLSDYIEIVLAPDCNSNNVDDAQDIAAATSQDCDADGVPDECETDGDGDGVIDDCDNCPQNANANQEDADGDGVGDACESGSSSPSPSSANPMSCGCFGPTLVPFALAYAFYVGHTRRRTRTSKTRR